MAERLQRRTYRDGPAGSSSIVAGWGGRLWQPKEQHPIGDR